MSISLEELKEQLKASEIEFEHAKAHIYRVEGTIQLLKHFIVEAEKNLNPPKELSPSGGREES